MSLIAGAIITASAAPASAVPIVGGISFSDGFQTTGMTTSIVSQLNNIDVINGAGVAQVTGCTGSFGNCTPPPAEFGLANDFTIGTVPVVMFTYTENDAPTPPTTTFTFTVTSFQAPTRNALSCVGQICTDSLIFGASGTVDDGAGGLDPSTFEVAWTANGSCARNFGSTATQCDSAVTASWSASISATGAPVQTPEPATLFLLGAGLFGFVVSRRTRQSPRQ